MKQEVDPPVAIGQPANWLLWRNSDRLSEFRSLPPDEAAAVRRVMSGGPFGEVCELLMEWHAVEQVAESAAGMVQHWIEAGLVSGFTD